MTHLVIKRDDLIYANTIAKAKDRHRILFEHYNGELYQLDIPLSIYNSLKLLMKDKKREYLN